MRRSSAALWTLTALTAWGAPRGCVGGFAVTSFARGAYDEAIQRVCRASDLNPSDPAPYIFLGKIELAEAKPSSQALEPGFYPGARQIHAAVRYTLSRGASAGLAGSSTKPFEGPF